MESDPNVMSYADIHGEWENREISIFGVVKSFISQLSIGQELTKVSMPSIFLMPYSVLELAASRYLKYFHILLPILQEADPSRRMAIVLQYFLTCVKDGNFQRKPYNALLGEVHQCFVKLPSTDGQGSTSQARFIGEQVTHHPPLSAFHISTPEGITLDCNVQFSAKFHMNSVSIVTTGATMISIPLRDGNDNVTTETYIIDKSLPDSLVKNVIFGTRSINWTDSVDIMCKSTNVSATLHFDKNEQVRGDIYRYNDETNQAEHHAIIKGCFSNIVTIDYLESHAKVEVKSKKEKKKAKKHAKSHKKQQQHTSATSSSSTSSATAPDNTLLNSTVLHPNQTLYPKQADPLSSLNVWKDVTKHIVANDMAQADVVKKEIEDEQRKRLHATKEDEKKERQYFKYDEDSELWVFKGWPTPN
ncbi:oxysterol binding family protein [Tieghemostelium lacteum]|uniref:Oxysterol binding family protein n=1 Tax=Tieghemostelium lacteum TaxID=361077 RepID=A0A152A4S6_TIELA|nr:oxysterol binding family protein [Tieghemostelium lacteum]|eukprot:KYR01246.1 oxysterol binding family protein [Tieghemostelium lacteum]